MNVRQPASIKILYAFAPQDQAQSEKLIKHLNMLKHRRPFIDWQPYAVAPGLPIEQGTDSLLGNADMILLFTSVDLMSSEQHRYLIQRVTERPQHEQRRVVQILLRPHIQHEFFEGLQSLPRTGQFSARENEDELFTAITRELDELIQSLLELKTALLPTGTTTQTQPSSQRRRATVYLQTVDERADPDHPADYTLNWTQRFVPKGNRRGHQLHDPSQWNAGLLAELEHLEGDLLTTVYRSIYAYGSSWLCCWLAFGYVFRSGFALECPVRGNDGAIWSTKAAPNPEFTLKIGSIGGEHKGEPIHDEGTTLAVSVSISQEIGEAVKAYINEHQQEKIAALLSLRPTRGTGLDALQSAEDAVALARQVKNALYTFVSAHASRGALKVLLFYHGPAVGACFIGHELNAISAEIQLMEYDPDAQGKYIPTFLLKP